MEPRIPYSFADPLKRKRASALAGRWGRAKYEQRWRGASQGPALPLATAILMAPAGADVAPLGNGASNVAEPLHVPGSSLLDAHFLALGLHNSFFSGRAGAREDREARSTSGFACLEDSPSRLS